MKRKTLALFCACAAILTACQEEEQKSIPMSMQIASGQVAVSGNQSGLVKADSSSVVIVRDSVANEATDTIYSVCTTLSLILDSTFVADKMEETLELSILANDGSKVLALAPTDSAIEDSLIGFLKKGVGEKVEIAFAGTVEKSKFLGISEATNVTLFGFSFHQLDPEASADPWITNTLKEYEKWGNQVVEEFKEFGMAGTAETSFLSDVTEDLDKEIGRMTPKQKKRYLKLRKRFIDYM